MLKRPLILKMFAFILFIDPFVRLMLMSIETEFSLWHVFQKTLELNLLDLFNFWLLFPISGILLLSVKLYSYLFFICLQFYSLYFHINYQSYSWPYLSKTPTITAYILLSINLTMVLYLLLPRSRELFFDSNLRWWERGSRFTIHEPCFAYENNREIHGEVIDLSYGGALLKLDEELAPATHIKINFQVIDKKMKLDAVIVRIVERNNDRFLGVQFQFNSLWQKWSLKWLMFSLAKVGEYELYRT